jgi:aspartate/methionine/tyrosine aminotransferase
MIFSTRSLQEDVPNRLTRALAEAKSRGPVLDLTVSNPTAAGIAYDEKAILGAFSDRGMLAYEPDPLGLESARATVAREIGHDSSLVALTASTSEAYAVLFKMLCDPGDEILVPAPSYPLLGWLAAFEAVKLASYPLIYAGGWMVDVGALRAAVTPRTKAIVVVSPNNPTGSYLGRSELEAILDLGLPIVSDEVFARYPLSAGVPDDRVATVLEAKRGLVFSLSGLSKLCGLPQMKLGWIAAGGDDRHARAAMQRLAIVLDAYLSVGTPVQLALPSLLTAGKKTARTSSERTKKNLAVVRKTLASAAHATVLDVEGGWYVTLRVPETMTDEEWALTLVSEDAVHVHPGFFFDLDRGAHLVVSLLTPEDDLAQGIERIARRLA